MTQPSYYPHVPAAPAAPPARRSRRGLVVGAVTAGVLVLGGAGAAVAAYLSGGGTQPEDVLPAGTLAFVTVDLDPAAGQKVAMMSLLDRFPALDDGADGDLRGQLLQPMLEVSEQPLDYAADVEPWLGDRMAVALVAAEGADGGGVPVVALAVDDESLMTETLTRVQQSSGLGFAVRDDFVLITDTQERADGFAAAERTLADDADFAGDREALGGDHLALAWADLSAFQAIVADQAAEGGLPVDLYGDQGLSGRMILGLHAQDDALELVGLDFSVSDVGVPAGEPTQLFRGLPEDTLGAVSASGLGDHAVQYWESLEQVAGGPGAGQDGMDPFGDEFGGGYDPFAALGLELHGDLRTLLGSDLALAVSGSVEAPSFGLRVATDDGARASELVESLMASPDLGITGVVRPAAGGYAFGTDEAALEAVSGTVGGLADTDAFRDAVADPRDATVVGFVDLATVVEQFAAQGGEAAVEAAKFEAVEALGFSVSRTDEGNRFVLRITTR